MVQPSGKIAEPRATTLARVQGDDLLDETIATLRSHVDHVHDHSGDIHGLHELMSNVVSRWLAGDVNRQARAETLLSNLLGKPFVLADCSHDLSRIGRYAPVLRVILEQLHGASTAQSDSFQRASTASEAGPAVKSTRSTLVLPGRRAAVSTQADPSMPPLASPILDGALFEK